MAVYKIDVRVDVENSLENFKKDLADLVKRADTAPHKIKVQLDRESFEKEIADLKKSVSSISSTNLGTTIKTAPIKKEATEVVSVFDQIEDRIKAIGGGQNALLRMQNALSSIKPVLEEDKRLAAEFYTATNQVYSGHFFEQLAYAVGAYSDKILDASQLTQQFDDIVKAQVSTMIPAPIQVDDTQIKQLRTLQSVLKKASLEVEEFTTVKKNTSWGMSTARLLSVIEQNASDAQLKVLGLKRSFNSLSDVKGLLIGLATGTQGVSYNDGFGLDSFKTSTTQIRDAISSLKEMNQRVEQDNAALIELRDNLTNTFGNLPADPNGNGALLVTLEQLRQVCNEAPAAFHYIDEIERKLNMSLYENRGVTETPISQIKAEVEEAASSEEHLKTVTQELTETVGSNSGMEQLISKLSEIHALIDSIAQSVSAIVGNKAISEVNPEMTEMVDNLSVVKKLMTDINGENRKIQKAYSKVVGGLKASPESEANASDLQMLQRELNTYNAKLKELRSNKAKATEEDIQGMHRTQAGINEIISRIQARIDAEAEAAKITNGDALIKRMTDASTAAHKLLDSNINSASDSAPYKQLHANLEEIDTILLDCGRDAEKLPNVLGMSAEEASTKIKTLLQTVSALQNELVYDSKSGTFKNRDVDNVLHQMITLRDKSVGSSGLEEYTNLTQQIEKFNAALQYSKEKNVSLNEAFNHLGTDGVSAIEAAKTAMEALKRVVAETAQAESEARAKASADLTAKWQSQGLTESNIKSLFGKAEKNQDLFKDVDGGFDAVREKYRQLIQLQGQWKAGGSNATAPEVESITKLRKELKGLIEERLADTKAAKQREVETKKQTAAETKRQSLLRQMYNLLTRLKKEEESWSAARNGKSSGAYSNLQQYQQKLGELIHAAETIKTPEGIEKISSQFATLTKRAAESEHVIRANGEATQTWRDRLVGLTDKFASWFGITRVIMAAVNAVRKMIASAKEIDSALTQLKIVTNATNEEMEAFANTAIDLAHNLGKSVVELTKSIETFSRLGYSLNDAAKLAKYATIMSNVAGVSTEEATTGLTSIIKGYDKDVEDAEHVADILVTVGQKYAVSAAEMMEAYEKSGAALHATNTSLEKSAGLIAAANASVQDASVVGK